MTVNREPKAAMQAEKSLSDPLATQGAVCIQPPPNSAGITERSGRRHAAQGRQPEGTGMGNRLGGMVLSIQAMTAPCR